MFTVDIFVTKDVCLFGVSNSEWICLEIISIVNLLQELVENVKEHVRVCYWAVPNR